MRQLQTPHAQELRLIYAEECLAEEAPLIEREAHSILAHKRLTGEWFRASMYDAHLAITLAADRVRMKDALEQYERNREPDFKSPRTDALESKIHKDPLKVRVGRIWKHARQLEAEVIALRRKLKEQAA
jgi:hypothetical protein